MSIFWEPILLKWNALIRCAVWILLNQSINTNEVFTIELNYVEGMKSYILLLGIEKDSILELV